jgi:hypothetical protein
MIYKLTSINTAISKVVRDLGLGDTEIPFQDMIEWMSEGLEHIGSYYQFTNKEAIILIEDYKGVLPCDFHESIKFLDGCSLGDNLGSGPFWTLVNNALAAASYPITYPAGTVEEGSTMAITDMLTFQQLQLVQYRKTGTGFSSLAQELQHSQSLMGQGLSHSSVGSTDYSINFDTVTTSFRYGYIGLRYQAIPVDENGYPLVPDNVSFMDAMVWKCAYHLSLRGHQFKNQQLNDFETCKAYWNAYCLQARAEANFPDPDMVERMARIFNTLSPNYHEYYEDFVNLGKPEYLNLNGTF